MTSISTRGARLDIDAPYNQDLEVLFTFDTDVSSWSWQGQVRASPEAADPLADFTITKPDNYSILATIPKATVTAELAVAVTYVWGIDSTDPDEREVFYGQLRFTQDTVR